MFFMTRASPAKGATHVVWHPGGGEHLEEHTEAGYLCLKARV